MSQRRRPRYLDALLRHLQETGAQRGAVTHVEIRHLDGCAFWRGKPCNCEPEVETGARIDAKYGTGESGGRP